MNRLSKLATLLICGLSLSACQLPYPPAPAGVCPGQACAEVVEDCPVEPVIEEGMIDAINELCCAANKGDVCAAVCLGRIYLEGKGVPADPEKAYKWYLTAANGGLPIAMVQVGHFYRDGLVCSAGRDYCKAICWYEKAACKGEVTAMLALGGLYKGHCGFKPDFKKALHWYEKAMEAGSMSAEYEVGWLLVRGVNGSTNSFNCGVEKLEKEVKAGNPNAMSAMGDLFLEGKVGCPNLCCAMQYYQRAALAGSAEGAYKLGVLFDTGMGVRKDSRQAIKWITMAAQRGFPQAQLFLGDHYRKCQGLDRCYLTAAQWYFRASESGCVPKASAALADMYLAGKGVPRMLEQAARLYTVAVLQGKDAYAALMLSVMYAEGYGVPFDLEKSVYYYKLAQKWPGFRMAEFRVGCHFENGFGLKQDLKEAIRWYTYAAEQCLPLALMKLADMYHDGYGLPQDNFYAYQLYKKAALMGHPYAQFMVGTMWLNGDGLKPDAIQAAAWFRLAAYSGFRQAQYQLGIMYIQGLGVPKSYPRAYGWLKNALHHMDDTTPEEWLFLAAIMDPHLQETAVLLAKQYEKKFPTTPRY